MLHSVDYTLINGLVIVTIIQKFSLWPLPNLKFYASIKFLVTLLFSWISLSMSYYLFLGSSAFLSQYKLSSLQFLKTHMNNLTHSYGFRIFTAPLWIFILTIFFFLQINLCNLSVKQIKVAMSHVSCKLLFSIGLGEKPLKILILYIDNMWVSKLINDCCTYWLSSYLWPCSITEVLTSTSKKKLLKNSLFL